MATDSGLGFLQQGVLKGSARDCLCRHDGVFILYSRHILLITPISVLEQSKRQGSGNAYIVVSLCAMRKLVREFEV